MNPRQRTGILMMIGAAVLAIVLFFVISNYVSGVNSKVAPVVTAYAVTEGVDAYAVIGAEDVEEVELPRRYLPDAAVTQLEDIIGRRAAFNIAAGTYVGSDMLRPNSSLGDNEREVALTVDATTGIAGRVAPGDFVDVIAVFQGVDDGPASSQAVARSVRIVSVGGVEVRTEQPSRNELQERSVIPVTLALTPDQTYAVALADATAISVRLIGLPDGIETGNRGGEPTGTNTSILQSQIN